MLRTKGDGVRAARDAISMYDSQRLAFEQLKPALRTAISGLRDRRGALVDALVDALVPDDNPETLTRLGAAAPDFNIAAARKTAMDTRTGHERLRQRLDRDQRFQRRDQRLNSELPQALAQGEARVSECEAVVGEFLEVPGFEQLYESGFHTQERGHTGLQSFWRMITLAPVREKRLAAQVCEALGHADFEKCAAAHDAASGALAQAQAEVEAIKAQRAELEEQITAYTAAGEWLARWPAQISEAIKAGFTDYVHTQPKSLVGVHNALPPGLRLMVAQLLGLGAIDGYLNDLVTFCSDQVKDRNKRVNALERVIPKWSRRPGNHLVGDKTKWLIDVPAMKSASTKKQVKWIEDLQAGLTGFDDWPAVSHALTIEGDEVPWYEILNAGSPIRLPYDGFVEAALPPVRQARRRSRLSRRQIRTMYWHHDDHDWDDWGEWAEEDYEDEDSYEEDLAEAAVAAMVVDEMINDTVDAS
ncbi:MAG: hypothetical protein ACE366_20110 [Bradymonadia bacterium]